MYLSVSTPSLVKLSTPSLVKLSDGANFLGLGSQTALHQQIRFFRSHMAGRDGSVTSSHLFCNISENNGTATLIL